MGEEEFEIVGETVGEALKGETVNLVSCGEFVFIDVYLILMSPLAKIRPVDDRSRGSRDFVSLSRSRSISHFFLQK